MNLEPKRIFQEYKDCYNFKNSIGSKGIYEQSRINERFYTGDQWYGVSGANDRPLVRHNIVKRIGEYKMSQIVSNPFSVHFDAEGVPSCTNGKYIKKLTKDSDFHFKGKKTVDEINIVLKALSQYHSGTAERVGFDRLCSRAIKNAYISGTGIIYTYWDPDVKTGLYMGKNSDIEITGDIKCEVLKVEDLYFADGYLENVQSQPFIIISSLVSADYVKLEAKKYGADQRQLDAIKPDSFGKVQLLTKLYKEYNADGQVTVKCVKVTEDVTVRKSFDTRLRLYPLSVFRWEERNNLAYGDTEVTYLIPNQIAINRMITANVWSSVTMGMPIMVVNGDTVNTDITNEPGQVIKIYGSNEDVAGAVKYITPPDCLRDFGTAVENLIQNTLVQSGANEVALGDSRPDNASALENMYSAATLPIKLIKGRFYSFVEEISRIWADFWVTQYGERKIRISDKSGNWYMPFDAERYKNLYLNAKVDVEDTATYTVSERIEILNTLYDQGLINANQFLERIPKGMLSNTEELFDQNQSERNESDDRV